MDPKIWGNNLWNILHIVAFEYPEHPSERDKEHYKIFYTNLKNILPCIECKKHYSLLIEKFPIDNYLETKKKLFKYIYLLHSKINKRLKKKNETFKNVSNYYKKLKKMCDKC